VLVHGPEPTQRTAALASLLSAVDAVPKVVPSDDRRAVKRRAKEIAEGEWAGVAVRKAVEAVNAAVATAVVATTSGG
jgi:enolase